jgi:excisionase family DNA binding protein
MAPKCTTCKHAVLDAFPADVYRTNMHNVHARSTEPQGLSLSYQVDELALELRVSRQTVYRGLRDGSIPSIRMGKRFVIPRAAIAEWLRTAGQQTVAGIR